jgi:hypothetical protein
MNFDKIDLEALQRDLEEFAREQRERGWFRRNWQWFVPTALLTVVVVGGAAIYWAMFLRVYGLEMCQSAMRTIEADKGLQAALGQPIRTVKWPSRSAAPSARIEETEADVLWSIEGPNGRARAHVKARRMLGKWETVTLDVVLPNGKKVLLNEAGGNEAPPADFSSPKAGSNKPEANAPPPDINLAPPDEGQSKK